MFVDPPSLDHSELREHWKHCRGRLERKYDFHPKANQEIPGPMAETEEKRQKKQMMDGNPYKVIVCIIFIVLFTFWLNHYFSHHSYHAHNYCHQYFHHHFHYCHCHQYLHQHFHHLVEGRAVATRFVTSSSGTLNQHRINLSFKKCNTKRIKLVDRYCHWLDL